jgi:hypothetical protein
VDRSWRDLIGSFFGVKPPPLPAEPQERRIGPRAATSLKVSLQWQNAKGATRTAKGVLENISSQGFAVRTKRKLLEGQTVWLSRPDSPLLKSVVRHVQQENGLYVLGFARVLRERRREDRSPATGLAALRWSGQRGETLSADVRIRNLASEGVQVESALSVPHGDVVRLIGAAVECAGAVRYCVPWKDKFLVGLFLIGKAHRRTSQPEYID